LPSTETSKSAQTLCISAVAIFRSPHLRLVHSHSVHEPLLLCHLRIGQPAPLRYVEFRTSSSLPVYHVRMYHHVGIVLICHFHRVAFPHGPLEDEPRLTNCHAVFQGPCPHPEGRRNPRLFAYERRYRSGPQPWPGSECSSLSLSGYTAHASLHLPI